MSPKFHVNLFKLLKDCTKIKYPAAENIQQLLEFRKLQNISTFLIP